MALPPPSLIDGFETFARGIVDTARELSMPHFRGAIDVSLKDDASPVTAVDRMVEAMVRERIQASYPEHGVLGEEYGALRTDAEYVWSIDPIDGTRSFISGWPLWGTLLALLRNGEPVIGLIDMPVLGERWIGRAGQFSTFNGVRCQTSACTRLSDATLYATTPDMFTAEESVVFERVSRAARTRRFGGDCYSYALLAAGHIDAVIEADLKPYDYLALAPVIEAAGGVITDWQGRRLGLNSGGQVIAAASAELHREIVETIQQGA
ncbi:histidinol phosphatase-like enzyme (inositol monophosphatase family) [Luteibacter rhizovicinus]|uniref:Histidinol-phosphatase n=1 Tax=Luteibacter rhizovicinus TaxID=242606 RepID=A0A4R3YPS2_9GAMM|nr:histidinol-phosphatase [Luteibacter rhizovicinus]TCV94767.1 histidinol phosphatase-like enzyme (inositol monophosphatase family) [Luteibacter rhizovicinus]